MINLSRRGGETSFETKFVRPDGTARHAYVKAVLETGPDGEPTRLSGFTQDITDSKNVALALTNSQELLDRAIEAANAAVWDWDVNADQIAAESNSPQVDRLSPMKILVAEDNPTTRMLVQSMLERDGHAVVTADNGAEAVEAATAEDFDIILMDMQMPIMDGPEAMQAIRSLGGPIAERPIIALTADAIRSHRQGYIDAGANVIVTKPIKWPVLFGEMNRLHGLAPKASNGQATPINGEHEADDMDTAEYEKQSLLDSAMLDALLEVLDEETLAPMLITFKENMMKYVGELDRLVDQNDLEQSKRTAHALKGLSAQFGASRVSVMAKSIEDEISDVEDVRVLLPLLRQSAEDTITALDGRA